MPSHFDAQADHGAMDHTAQSDAQATVDVFKLLSLRSILAFFTKNGVVYEVKFGCKNENFSGEKGAIDLVLSSLKV